MVWLKVVAVVAVTVCASAIASWAAWTYGTATSEAFADEVHANQITESVVNPKTNAAGSTTRPALLPGLRPPTGVHQVLTVNDAEAVAVADLLRPHGGLSRAGVELVPPTIPEHKRTSLDVLPYVPSAQVRTNRRSAPIAAANLKRAALASITYQGYSRLAWLTVHQRKSCPTLDVMDALEGETVLTFNYCDK